MSECVEHESALCARIAEIIADFRQDEMGIPKMDAAHVGRWVGQFEQADRLPILAGMAAVLPRSYFSRARTLACIQGMVRTNKIARGVELRQFWRSVGFLKLQEDGKSQVAMLEAFDQAMREALGFGISDTQPDGRTYLYLDDALFSGNQAGKLLKKWIEENDAEACRIIALFMGIHTNGEWYLCKRLLKDLADKRGIEIDVWHNTAIENSLTYRYSAHVLWPTAVPTHPAVQRWEATLQRGRDDWFHARPPGGGPSTEWFGSEEIRQVMERAFFEKGAEIIGFSQEPNPYLRPLGFSKLESPGFGTLFATHWNCPNNAPLVLHWGDPNESGPLGRWYPLLPRRAWQRTSAITDFSALFDE